MNKLKFSSLLVLTTLCLTTTAAAEGFDPAGRATVIAPFVDDQAVAIAHVDLTRVKPQALIDHAIKILRLPKEETSQANMTAQMAQATLDAFVAAGCKEIYLVLSLADIPPGGPILIAPVAEQGNRLMVAKLLEAAPWGNQSRSKLKTSLDFNGVVVVGPEAAFERFKEIKANRRPSLAQAFEAVGDTAAQLLITPSDDHRRALREMLPQLPAGVGTGDELAAGLQWAAVGVELEPELSFRLVIQSKDDEAAEAMKRIFASSLKKLGGLDEVRNILPISDDISSVLVPQVQGSRLTLRLSQNQDPGAKIIASLARPLTVARQTARRSSCTYHLKYLALAMHNFHDQHEHFPARVSYDKNGKPLLSWRVSLLPYLDQSELYEKFHLDEPWDSPHNSKLISQTPEVFACPSAAMRERGMTTYLAPLAEGTVFDSKEGIAMKDIRDGTSNTIMIVDAAPTQAVIWTKPDDLKIDLQQPLRGLGSQHANGFNAVFCDGAVHFISKEIDLKLLRRLFTRSDGEVIGEF